MEWLTAEEAKRLFRSAGPAQMIMLAADLAQLRKEIPLPPVPSDGGPPTPSIWWFARTKERYIQFECQEEPLATDAQWVLIYTPFLKQRESGGDWEILRELGELPSSIFALRPLFIESRFSESRDLVYRPHPRGWKDMIYAAASHNDAFDLLEYLRLDPWNDTCFVASPEPEGKWSIITRSNNVIGCYPSLEATLRVACNWDLPWGPDVILTVRDPSGQNPNREYQIAYGRVIGRP